MKTNEKDKGFKPLVPTGESSWIADRILSIVVAAGADGGVPPREFRVFRLGENRAEGYPPFFVDAAAMAGAIAEFERRGLDLVIDYEHQTETGDEAPAAGWITKLFARADGLWAACNWTERAAARIAAREYRYFSPVFAVGKNDDRLRRLLRLALTNAPRLDGLIPLAAKDQSITPAGAAGDNENMKGNNMLQRIAKLLGLAADAGEEAVFADLAKRLAAPPAPEKAPIAAKSVLAALGVAETANESEIVAACHALKQAGELEPRLAKLETENSELRRAAAALAAETLVAAALKDGKITPAQQEWAAKYASEDAEGFKSFVAKAPRVVPVERLGDAPPRAAADAVADGEQKRINKLLGVSDETWAKHGPAASAANEEAR